MNKTKKTVYVVRRETLHEKEGISIRTTSGDLNTFYPLLSDHLVPLDLLLTVQRITEYGHDVTIDLLGGDDHE